MGLHLKGRWGCKRHHESPFQGEECYRTPWVFQGRGAVKESKGLWTRVGGYKQKLSPSFITVGPEVV